MTKLILNTILGLIAFGATAQANFELPEGLTRDYVVSKSNPTHVALGIEGYDPVSFFDEAPAMGVEAIKENFGGVTYLFSNEENKQRFLENPNKFEPTYGGWCAWAMAQGGKVTIDPQFYSFDLDENGEKIRIHFFVAERAMANFHNRRKTRGKSSLEILDLMKTEVSQNAVGAGSVLATARGFQDQADANWLDILVNDK